MKLFNDIVEDTFGYKPIRVDNAYDEDFLHRHYINRPGYTTEEYNIILKFLKEQLLSTSWGKEGNFFPARDSTVIFSYHGERGPEYPEFEKILIELKKEHPTKKFICTYNDWREFDTEFTYIVDLMYWPETLFWIKDSLNEIKNISNSHKRKKLFISKNRTNNSSGCRARWVDFMKKNNLLEDAYYSIGWEGKWLEDDVGESTTGMNGPDDYKVLDFYKDVFVEVVTESLLGHKTTGHGYYNSEKLWRPFLMCIIPIIITFPDVDVHLKDMGFDMFDDVIDTSFYKLDNFDKQFEIIKENLKIIENDLTVDGRFRDDIWVRLKKNQNRFFEGWGNYFYSKMEE